MHKYLCLGFINKYIQSYKKCELKSIYRGGAMEFTKNSFMSSLHQQNYAIMQNSPVGPKKSKKLPQNKVRTRCQYRKKHRK